MGLRGVCGIGRVRALLVWGTAETREVFEREDKSVITHKSSKVEQGSNKHRVQSVQGGGDRFFEASRDMHVSP
jgi:hypothetical protein